MKTVFLRALNEIDKASAVLSAISDTKSERRFDVDISTFHAVPGSPFSYWVGEELRRPFVTLPAFESNGRSARQGLATADDFRFVRAWWEPSSVSEKRWLPFAKGGAFSPYYADVYLAIDWKDYGKALDAFAGSVIRNPGFYQRPGLTWPRRTNGLSLRIMPTGCVFADKGPAAFIEGDDPQRLLALLAITNSKAFYLLVELQLARTELAQSFEVGLIQQTPIPTMTDSETENLASLAHQAWQLKRSADTRVETSHAFTVPAILQVEGHDLSSRIEAWIERTESSQQRLASLQAAIDTASFDLYGIADADTSELNLSTAEAPSNLDEFVTDDEVSVDPDEEAAILEVVGPYATTLVLATELASWVLGVAFGRFDLRLATGARTLQRVPGPFDALPTCSPGMFTDSIGTLADATSEYLPGPSVSGIIVDDPGHANDLGEHQRRIFEAVFGDHADTWSTEVTATLNPDGSGLREWSAEHLFDFHLKRYTKSKRRAPIYSQLAVPSGRYSIWLYAPRLTTDTFFRLLHDVVTPKLVHEEHTLESRRQGGELASGRELRELEEQENFVAELRQLADEIRRVAPLWNPHLDDGIVLVMAPLWRLMPRHKAWQKELRAKWQELQSGKYDWAHLAMHLWPERVIPKCATDRSLAIAHGLEDTFWLEAGDGKWTPRGSPTRAQELVAERASSSLRESLKNFLEAPEPFVARRSRKPKGR